MIGAAPGVHPAKARLIGAEHPAVAPNREREARPSHFPVGRRANPTGIESRAGPQSARPTRVVLRPFQESRKTQYFNFACSKLCWNSVLAISEYVAGATGNALIAITVEADFEVRPLVHLRAAFRSCGSKKDP